MLRRICLIFWILIFFPAASLEASPETIRKVFETIEKRYADPVRPAQIYARTLDQMKKSFPDRMTVEDLSTDAYRITCDQQTVDLQLSRRDQVANIGQMKNVLELCTPPETLKIMRKNQLDGEQIVLDMLLGALDSHSSYMNADMVRELNTGLSGRFGGIGAEITLQDGVITVVSPIDDTPAFLAGIKPGDQIIKINDVPTKGMTTWEAVKKIRGPENTKVRLTLLHKKEPKPRQLTITRAIINVKTVKYKLHDDQVGYIRMSSFQEKTADDLRAALSEMDKKSGPLKGLLLDLRNNPGGLMDQAIRVSDQFLTSGVIVSTRGRIKFLQNRTRASNRGDEPAYPIVILINEGTASSAEIVSGALQDNRRALLVGTQTFGKGSVQTIFPLDDGSAIKLTTSRYYTPGGRVVHENGITPDVLVGNTQGIREKDLQLHRKEDRAELKKKVRDPASRDVEMEKEAQLQIGLQLLRKAIAAGDLQKGLHAFNTAGLL
jgi:carboxyl-terminal processing protease